MKFQTHTLSSSAGFSYIMKSLLHSPEEGNTCSFRTTHPGCQKRQMKQLLVKKKKSDKFYALKKNLMQDLFFSGNTGQFELYNVAKPQLYKVKEPRYVPR